MKKLMKKWLHSSGEIMRRKIMSILCMGILSLNIQWLHAETEVAAGTGIGVSNSIIAKAILAQIDLLPPLFYAYLDKPARIESYKSYNRETGELVLDDPRIRITPVYHSNSANLLETIEIQRQDIDSDGNAYAYSEKFHITYNDDKTICRIASETAPKRMFEFIWADKRVVVSAWNNASGGNNADVIFSFDLKKQEVTRQWGKNKEVRKFSYIQADASETDTISTPQAQSLYNEYIHTYDGSCRLILFLDVNYDKPGEAVLHKDPWSVIYRLSY